MSEPEIQSINSWTGFIIKICSEIPVILNTMGYLPTISVPATAPLNEVLEQTLHIMQALRLVKIVCVFDQQTLYDKAVEIV